MKQYMLRPISVVAKSWGQESSRSGSREFTVLMDDKGSVQVLRLTHRSFQVAEKWDFQSSCFTVFRHASLCSVLSISNTLQSFSFGDHGIVANHVERHMLLMTHSAIIPVICHNL